MSILEDVCDRLAGSWTGTGIVHPSPWSRGGPVAVAFACWRLTPSPTAILRYTQRDQAEAAFESVTAVSLAEPARVWAFDTMGFLPEEPGQALLQDGALVIERRSPRGTNRTVYALREADAALSIQVGFVAAGDTSAMPVAEAALVRRPDVAKT